MSPAHLQRYVNEFASRHNQRLRYKDLAVRRGRGPYRGPRAT